MINGSQRVYGAYPGRWSRGRALFPRRHGVFCRMLLTAMLFALFCVPVATAAARDPFSRLSGVDIWEGTLRVEYTYSR